MSFCIVLHCVAYNCVDIRSIELDELCEPFAISLHFTAKAKSASYGAHCLLTNPPFHVDSGPKSKVSGNSAATLAVLRHAKSILCRHDLVLHNSELAFAKQLVHFETFVQESPA